ncbi:hypothetical protein EVAR_23086_1 [Eumeta japonica]|uniref:Uncharacterized protein n=1 Tax=Eumeta variegata TaxID=151549 RepID=A0A4C1VMK8_EUMVA|nr:hypothetical protein EVAR_23086_1 [Eumeta japonica]
MLTLGRTRTRPRLRFKCPSHQLVVYSVLDVHHPFYQRPPSDRASINAKRKYKAFERRRRRERAAAARGRCATVCDCLAAMIDDLRRRLARRAVPGPRRRITQNSGREIDASQAERLGRLSIACSALSLARSAQAERDNESCFFVHAADVHRFIRRMTRNEHFRFLSNTQRTTAVLAGVLDISDDGTIR